MLQKAFGLLFLLLFAGPAWGHDITYGAEFEFTNDWVNEVQVAGRLRGNEGLAARQLADVVRAKCLQMDCKVTEVVGKWTKPELTNTWDTLTKPDRFNTPEFLITFKNGLWLNISYDPLCIEVQSKPMTMAEWKKNAPVIEEILFNSAKSINLAPRPERAGHFNIGILSAFDSNQNVESFVRFFVDYANHAELASGILRKNWSTAVPLALQGYLSKFFLKILTVKVKLKQITTIDEAAQYIHKYIYRTHPEPKRYSILHNQAMNLQKVQKLEASFIPGVTNDKALEIRAVRAQKSVHEFIQLAEIFESRIRYVKEQSGPIEINIPDIKKMSDAEALARFNAYVTEAGRNPENYKNLIPENYFPAPDVKSCHSIF